MNESWKRKYSLLIAIAISVISAFMLLFLMICFGFFPIRIMEGSMLVGLTMPTVISLYLFPKLCQKTLMPERNKSPKEMKQRWKAILFLVGFAVLYGIICRKEFESIPMMAVIILHYTSVSLGEEFTYRKLILGLLNTRYKTWIAVVVNAIMFSFILHINEDLIANLLIRFPMGIVLGCIAVKTNTIAYTIVLHTIYNLIVLIL
ncbi:MAG: lysostaphin resistance A-like protein [Blautia sp.]